MIDASERALLEETVRKAIAGACAAADGGTRSTRCSRSSDGWRCSRPSPRDAIDIVFSALGDANAAATALDDVVASALGTAPRADLAVLLPPFARMGPPGRIDGEPSSRAGTRDGSRRHGDARCWSCAAAGRSSWVATVPIGGRRSRARCTGSIPMPGFRAVARAASDGGRQAARRRRVGSGRRARPARGRAPDRGSLPSHARRSRAPTRWSGVQFGRPIARFQAVRHRLADALVAVEALEATLAAAAGRAELRHRGAREGLCRAHGPNRGRALPAGARRNRLHHRASVPPFPQADDGARRAVRIGRRDRRRGRPRSCSPRARFRT